MAAVLSACGGGGGDTPVEKPDPAPTPELTAEEKSQARVDAVAQAAGLQALPEGTILLSATAGDTLQIAFNETTSTATITPLVTAFGVQPHSNIAFRKTATADGFLFEAVDATGPWFSIFMTGKYRNIRGQVMIDKLKSQVVGTNFQVPSDLESLKIDGIYNLVGSTDSIFGSTRELERASILINGATRKICLGGFYIETTCSPYRLASIPQSSQDFPSDFYPGDGSDWFEEHDIDLHKNAKGQVVFTTMSGPKLSNPGYNIDWGTLSLMPTEDGVNLLLDVLEPFEDPRVPPVRSGLFFATPQKTLNPTAEAWKCVESTTKGESRLTFETDGTWTDERSGSEKMQGKYVLNKVATLDASKSIVMQDRQGWGSMTYTKFGPAAYGVGAPFFIRYSPKTLVLGFPESRQSSICTLQ